MLSQSDPTISTYSIAFIPTGYNNQSVYESDYPKTYDFSSLYNQPVNAFNGQTINDILNNPQYHDTKINSINISLSGNHYYDCSDGTIVIMNIYDKSGNNIDNFSYGDNPPGLQSGTSYFNIMGNIINPPILDRYTLNFYRFYKACKSYPFNNVILTFIVNMQVGLCNAQSIGKLQCIAYCSNPKYADNCKADYINYCFSFTNNDPTTMPIGTNTPSGVACQNFIKDNGPTAAFDEGIRKYCSAKYGGFGDLFNSNNELDKNLCACHMPEPQYTAFQAEIAKNYIGFGNLGFINQCLVPQCASSDFKTTVIGKACELPACLNIATFTNQGTFDNSNVTINQNISGCANIKPISGPNPPPNPNNLTWLWVTIGVILGIIILAIIIILIVMYSRKRRVASILEQAPVYQLQTEEQK
jgi:hypothetical protein